MIAICVAAFFTHVFEWWFFQLMTLGCVLIIGCCAIAPRNNGTLAYAVMAIVAAALILFSSFEQKLLHAKNYRYWQQGRILIRAGVVTEGLAFYKAAYSGLAQYGPFLEDYGHQLFVLKRHKQAITILREALQYRIHQRMYIHLGKSYQQAGNLRAAEEALLKAVYMVPNRFESRFALFKYYQATGRKREARQWGNSILELPIKVPSMRVDKIRRDVIEYISIRKVE